MTRQDVRVTPVPGRLRFLADARHRQIAALSILLAVNFLFIDFGAKPLASALAIAASVATQAACAWWFGLKHLDLRSPLITGLSLSLLLRADEPALHAVAGVLAILSKFVLRHGDKHVFNPAGFAIVALLFFSDHVWISPGQWGTSVWFAALVAFGAILVLRAARRADIAAFFLTSHAGLLIARALWLGDPLAIPLHQLQSGSLLIFAFFRDFRPAHLARCAARALHLCLCGGARRALARLFHADAAGALHRADRALAVHPADRPHPGRAAVRLDRAGHRGSLAMVRTASRLKVGVAAGALLALAALAGPAWAFCGFYVAQADAKLFNKSSKVVLARDGEKTAITMANDYQGDAKEFAVVIPVSSFIERKQIGVVDMPTIDHLDTFTAPRLVEYHDDDPCAPRNRCRPRWLAAGDRSCSRMRPTPPLATRA